MSTERASLVDPEIALIEDIARFRRDPLGYVLYAFPWGRGELAAHLGPRKWQAEVLQEIGTALRTQHDRNVWEVVQHAVASGHGVGKSALISMLLMWAMSTHEDTRGIVTANTDTQLRTKTWPEVAKWHRLAINAHWFTLTATRMCAVDRKHADTWRVDIIPWSEHNTEAFAGLHNEGKRIIVIFDEASAIDDKIWEVSEGALTDARTEILWIVCGNPTRQNGRFADAFGRFAHRWVTRRVDSRTVEGTNLAQIEKWVADHGENSDLVRVRVRGENPLQAEYQLIDQALVADARLREVPFDQHQPIVAGLDLARSGSCETVLAFRCGRDGRSLPWCMWRERDSAVLAGKIAQKLDDMRSKRLHVHTVFADGGGLGGPIIDILRQSGYPMREVLFGGTPTNAGDYRNKGSEMWALMRDWMSGGAIPNDPELERQLVSRDYGYDPRTHQLQLVPKEFLLREGLPSPDRADALALTFAYPIAPSIDVAISGLHEKCLNDLDGEAA